MPSTKAAERCGAGGILLLPRYLSQVGQHALTDHLRTVRRATELGVILDNRANARHDADTVERLAAECPHLIGCRDGRRHRTHTYSSALCNLSWRPGRSTSTPPSDGDHAHVRAALNDFVIPYGDLRIRTTGTRSASPGPGCR